MRSDIPSRIVLCEEIPNDLIQCFGPFSSILELRKFGKVEFTYRVGQRKAHSFGGPFFKLCDRYSKLKC